MKILSSADIHLRPLERHDEFDEIMSNIEQVILDKTPDYFVIAGDLYHSKVSLTPEASEIISLFLERMSNLVQLIIIPGNHDGIITNTQRLDALSPFINSVNKMDIKYKIIYLKNTTIHTIGDVSFITESIFDDTKIDFETVESLNSKYKIGILHGTFTGSEDENGFKLHGKPLPDWNSLCNYVILGDIHKRQVLTYK